MMCHQTKKAEFPPLEITITNFLAAFEESQMIHLYH